MTAEAASEEPGGWTRRTVRIENARGLHARAAAKFVMLAGRFDAAIKVCKNDTCVAADSIMGLMMLAAGPGSELVLAARGAEARAALEALCALVGRGFDEG